MNYIRVTYRDIAKMLVKAMPVEDDSFKDKVEEYINTLRALPREAKVALKSAYIFSRKVPKEEKEDLFQDLALAILKAKTGDERLAYAIARCDWRNWWGKFRIRQHYSLDSVVEDNEGNQVALSELLIGECEFEIKINGELDGQRIWDKLPGFIKSIIQTRLMGKALNNTERSTLSRWIKKEGYQLLLAA